MVAAARALETEMEDAFVRDPFAARLAGERGMEILRALPHAPILRHGVAVRSRFIDELLLEALSSSPIATVLSVGCGLDARPWRLDLAPALRWIEVDFPGILDYKEQVLAGETPRCRRERLSVDLNDPAQRPALFDAAGPQPALMITEGLLQYLPGATVEALAQESAAGSGLARWIADITTSAFAKVLGGADTMNSLRHVQASDHLQGEQILDIAQRHGWTTVARRSYITDVGFAAERVRRMMGGKTPPPLPIPPGDLTGVHCFTR